jgi:hypothetical protein
VSLFEDSSYEYFLRQSQSQSYFTSGGSPPINSSWRQSLETHDQQFFFQLTACFRSPYVTSSRHNCSWSSPAQSFSGPTPAGLVTIFYCLKFETLPTWRARSPYLYPATGFPFRRLLRLAGLLWRCSTPPPHGILPANELRVLYNLARTRNRTSPPLERFVSSIVRIRCHGNVC